MPKKIKALIIEDSEDDALLIKEDLEASGYDLESVRVETPTEMSAALRDHTFDIVLADYNVPSFNAPQALKLLQETKIDIPFIIVSGSVGEQIAVQAMRDGAQDYIMKNNLARLGVAVERELRDAEIRREKRHSELEARIAARQWQETFDSIGDIVLIIDKDYRVLQANKTAREQLGDSDLVGRLCYELVHNCHSPPECCGHDCVFSSGLQLVTEARERNLNDKWFEIRTFPIKDKTGEVLRIVHSFRDISERKKAEEALRNTEAQLRQSEKLQAIGQLAGGIAHDFNNLLAVIKGYVDLALSTTTPEDRYNTYFSRIRDAVVRASTLTRQILVFSRQQILEMKPLNINDVIIDFHKMLARLVNEDIVFQTNLCPDIKTIEGDKGQIEQIVLNLVVNARDAMPDGGTLLIETQCVFLSSEDAESIVEASPGNYVLLCVKDSGSGMDDNIQKLIFDPFFTTKELGRGTGLGLSTVFGIVKQHHGFITVDSQIGKGSVFNIFFPVSHKEIEVAREHTKTRENLIGTETILVVEDETEVRHLIAGVLQEYGYNVLESINGAHALEQLEATRTPIDLLVSDIIMPKLKGPQLHKKLVQLYPNLKVLFMSGYSDKELMDSPKSEVNGHPFLAKPFAIEELLQKIRHILDTPNTVK